MLEIYFSKILRKLNLNRLFFSIALPFWRNVVCINNKSVEYSYSILERTHKDTGGSCIINNMIKENPSYDLMIIVPAYNVEKYIGECIESIIRQQIKYNVIVKVVDDGSTDGTWDVIQKYSNIENICCIRKNNGGQASACNFALKEIDAKYIMFVDADDQLKDGSINALLDCAYKNEDVDVIEGEYEYFSGNRVILRSRRETGKFEDWTRLLGFQWLKIYKSYMFDGIGFSEGYWHSDTVGHFIRYNLAKKIMIIPEIIYRYRKNTKGVSFTARRNPKAIDAIWITQHLLKDKENLGQTFTQTDYHIFLNQTAHNMYRLLNMESEVQKAAFIVLIKLKNRYYKGFHCLDGKLIDIEKYLQGGDFGAFVQYCKYIY